MSYNTCVGFLPLVNSYKKFFAKKEHMEYILDILSIAFDEDLNAVVVKENNKFIIIFNNGQKFEVKVSECAQNTLN